MGKWELTMNPVQEWGEECEDGAVYGITLHRVPVPSLPNPADANPSCAFVQYRTVKIRRLKAGGVQKLVSHLLEPACVEQQDYSRIFLTTYRTFTSTEKLLELIFHRNGAASQLDTSEYNQSPPLLALVQTWLDEYSEDFRDPPLHSGLRLLLDHLRLSCAVHDQMRSQPNFCSLAGQAENLLRRFQEEEAETNARTADVEQDKQLSSDEDSGCENSQDQGDILDFSAGAIAQQLTRIDSALFVKVAPYQCLGCIWSQRDKKENMSPTIRATVAQFNAITNLVIVSLLCRPTCDAACLTSSCLPPIAPPHRARIIEKWIRIAQECRSLKNFSSLRAILSALQSNAVYRLRKTWAAVGRDSMATFDNLCESFPDENCLLTNRALLMESTSSGVVPYLGTYLTVLTMLDTALPDTLEGGLINFEKRRREFEVLSQICVLQSSCSKFSLPHHPRIAEWMQGHKLLTDQESYELSRQLEPPMDVCSPTAWSHRTLTKKLSSILTMSDGSKKLPADQISVSSSGSSGSELEDLSSTNSACSIRLQSFHSSSNNLSEAFSSSSSSSSSPCSSATSSTDSPTPPGSSSDSLCSSATSRASASPACSTSHHKRSVSMTSLPIYNRQDADACIVRVSVDLGRNDGNMYKSILLTSQDKTAHVIERALDKHHLEHMDWQDFTLTQVISQERELLIPDKANVFYAMSTTANFDFVLRRFRNGQKKPLRATSSLGRYSK
ncbi:ral guanine nucleotide dissociation stimulator-like 1 isoform X1 [Nerophis ophidion]|uniref:ral guanine nucleotide dissociation stimulator-like 1 isoform X1 n=1 Tax=Nerophis ophidion TaxID=159077 RepID=UPI002ADF6505|nr:ral guanine nucleotide dissociation stimulator-like 1 isoform X1 [Nerophis ophidion]